eukprot:9976259-Prorocentrum_lima.AAC.1
MTSSLVGSEMCIRDSPTSAASAAQRESRSQGSTAMTSRVYSSGLTRKGPVSYTHLTLPTICSV